MNFKKQLSIIESIISGDEIDIRMDCPFCNNQNTLTIKKSQSKLMWYCFHASCNARGTTQKEMTIKDVESQLLSENTENKKRFKVPEHFVTVLSTEKCLEYMKKNNCMRAYNRGFVDMKYDVKQHRIVFLIKKRKEIIGAVGRGLNSEVYPKWFMYGEKSYPFMCGNDDTGVLVEDCASACAVSHLYCGIALMGTSLPESYIPIIKERFKKIIVALDRDATVKAFDIANKLRYYINTEVKMLDEDLKYYNEKQLDVMFKKKIMELLEKNTLTNF